MFADQVKQLLDSPELVAVKHPEAISNLHSVYKQLFGEGIKKQCGDCLTKALLRIRKYVYLQSQNIENFNLETMKKFEDKNFVLAKGKALDVGRIGVILTNENMTDETAVRILTAFPNLIKYFVKFPANEAGELDLSGFELSAKKGSKAPELTEQQKAEAAAKALQTKTPVVPVVKNTAPETKTQAEVPVVKLPVDKKEKSAATKPAPGKAAANRLPNEGETIEQAAERFGVSGRTIERDMKAAGVDVAAWKAKTVVAETPASTTEVKIETEGSTAASEEEKQKEGEEGQQEEENQSGVTYVDFIVTQDWLDANKEDAEAEKITLGETIELASTDPFVISAAEAAAKSAE